MSSIVIRNASMVVPLSGSGPIRGPALQAIDTPAGVPIVCEGERISAVDEDARGAAVEIDASECTVTPGFVDPHTHLPFYGWRADEDAARLAGNRYEQLHAEDRGIYRSARLLAEASDEEVLAFSRRLAEAMLKRGTTCLEMKSGYGLSVEGELRQLRLARALGDLVPQRVATTCLAAHAVPPGKSAGEWVGEAAEELLPRAAEQGLAAACDAYVESIAFALEHAARLGEVARNLGLRARVHADQLADNQTAAFAARWRFGTADHLNHASLDAVDDLAASDTTAVLLPGATFTLRQSQKPPARDLVEAGAVVAIGTDLNPGTSPISSMPFAIALACRLYGLRPLEALAASTVNAALALGLDDVGRIAPGYRADVLVLDAPSFDYVPYRPDHNPVLVVVCGGKLAHVAPRARARIRSSA